MQERVKVFTFVSGHGETVVEPPHEEHINQWLATVRGRLVQVSQSEGSGRERGATSRSASGTSRKRRTAVLSTVVWYLGLTGRRRCPPGRLCR